MAHDMLTSSLFGVLAPEFGWVPPPRFLMRRDRILRLLPDGSLGKIVEVGCGSGALLHELASRSEEAVGLETSDRARSLALKIAICGGGKQRVIELPADEWRQDRDMVCAFDVLEHIEHDQEAIVEWASWLRTGGLLCVSVPAHKSRWGAGDEWAGHWRRYDRADLENVVRSGGFSIEHVECYGFPLGNLSEWYGERFYRRALNDRSNTVSRADATGASGVERTFYVRKLRWLDSPLGRLLLRTANLTQRLASRTDWGSGYLLLARKT